MSRFFILAAVAALGGCATAPAPEPVRVTVSGPKFPPTAFTCKRDAVPPNPATVGNKAGSAAGGYEAAQRAVTADCRNKLHAVGAQERAAGNIIESSED
ncbi:hypothetical protein NB311A_06678 [Nitrobacter sp. Nb-311A]|uniref:hypothetical protein n=1 Tax=Nitrobacter sp. Nb-311A TaxID=314253 RepID=UPI000068718C|nr:hypothetical protein [Nitrobacter sp. Nb-311A]EAQ34063.1 hypothetical protein NB311A_06678 [Nitrobacter sp. Nb-311A]